MRMTLSAPLATNSLFSRIRHAVLTFFFFPAEDGIRDGHVTGVQTCALPISSRDKAFAGKRRTSPPRPRRPSRSAPRWRCRWSAARSRRSSPRRSKRTARRARTRTPARALRRQPAPPGPRVSGWVKAVVVVAAAGDAADGAGTVKAPPAKQHREPPAPRPVPRRAVVARCRSPRRRPRRPGNRPSLPAPPSPLGRTRRREGSADLLPRLDSPPRPDAARAGARRLPPIAALRGGAARGGRVPRRAAARASRSSEERRVGKE